MKEMFSSVLLMLGLIFRSFIYLFIFLKKKNAHNYFSRIAFLPVNSS